ncbi:GGDEF domain-containing protein [Colwelliaceae bacterium 6471]
MQIFTMLPRYIAILITLFTLNGSAIADEFTLGERFTITEQVTEVEGGEGLDNTEGNLAITVSDNANSTLLDQSPIPINARIIELLELSLSDRVKALQVFTKVTQINSTFNVAERFLLHVIEGNLAAGIGEHSKAIEHLTAAKSLIDKIAQAQLDSPLFSQLHLSLADSYVALGQYEQAFVERKEHQTKYKAYIKAQKEQTIDTLNGKYETTQKEKENELLQNENHLKTLQIQEAESNKAIQQRNIIVLICTAVVFFLLIIRQIRVRRFLRRLSETDNLTGLLNRGALFKRGQKLINQAVEQENNLSLILLDVDNFKLINDNYGHDIGDKVLKIITELGSETMRSRDIFARLGGEEFVAILPEASLDEAKAIAERFREKMEMYDLSVLGVEQLLSASFGVVSLEQVVPEFDLLIHAADEAMYKAKNSGRNQVCVYKKSA